jgi:ribonuclease PH
LVEFGDTKVIVTASVEEKQPRWMKEENKGWITAEYSLLPGSTHTRVERERGIRVSGRTQEIQRLIGRSLRACVDLNKLGSRTITIDADVIQADGGTRTASISGGFVALSDAINKLIEEGKLEQNPIIQPIAAISAGILEGEIRLDLEYEEDFAADVDANIVMMEDGSLVEFQATSEGQPYTKEEMFELLKISEKGIKEIIKLQEEVLLQE